MDEISRQTKRKGFFYRLVRPWKWRKPKRNKSKDKMRVDDSRTSPTADDFSSSLVTSTVDPNSVTVFNPIHRSPQVTMGNHQNGLSPQQRESAMMHHHPAGHRARSEPTYPQQQAGYGYGTRTSTGSVMSSMSAPPEGYAHYSHPPMSNQTLMEEASETSLPNSSSLSDRRNAPGPLTKPKDRKMVGLAVPNSNSPASPRSILKGGRTYGEERATQPVHRQQSPQYRSPQHTEEHTDSGSTPRKQKRQPDGYYVVYSPDDDLSSDEEDGDGEYGDEEEEEEVGVPVMFGGKVIRNDSIAILRERRKHESIATQPPDQRAAVEVALNRRLSQRPTKIELKQRNIIQVCSM